MKAGVPLRAIFLPMATLVVCMAPFTATCIAEESALPDAILQMRDPFKRPVLIVPSTEVKTPLQLHPVGSLKFVAVVTGPLHLRAMVKTPDGKTHFVSEKTSVGPRGGTVLKITQDRILIRERIANILGQIENVDTELPLSQESENEEEEPEAPGPEQTEQGQQPQPR